MDVLYVLFFSTYCTVLVIVILLGVMVLYGHSKFEKQTPLVAPAALVVIFCDVFHALFSVLVLLASGDNAYCFVASAIKTFFLYTTTFATCALAYALYKILLKFPSIDFSNFGTRLSRHFMKSRLSVFVAPIPFIVTLIALGAFGYRSDNNAVVKCGIKKTEYIPLFLLAPTLAGLVFCSSFYIVVWRQTRKVVTKRRSKMMSVEITTELLEIPMGRFDDEEKITTKKSSSAKVEDPYSSRKFLLLLLPFIVRSIAATLANVILFFSTRNRTDFYLDATLLIILGLYPILDIIIYGSLGKVISVSFKDVLVDPENRTFFMCFLESEFAAEGLRFLQSTWAFDSLFNHEPPVSKEDLIRSRDYIIRTFLVDGAIDELNICATSKSYALSFLSSESDRHSVVHQGMFNDVCREVMLALRHDNFPRFRESDEYHSLVQRLRLHQVMQGESILRFMFRYVRNKCHRKSSGSEEVLDVMRDAPTGGVI
eukprot:TRINITY_DN625_c0_g1_i2.p1 TRINITY_DN625_c0_g1~~TRINITY_DN625_c0_g1_i2.p1  ORF type:complete len:529 (-),score=86.10 TRINITY_DN625_c0_g1_i2:761-2209(-)